MPTRLKLMFNSHLLIEQGRQVSRRRVIVSSDKSNNQKRFVYVNKTGKLNLFVIRDIIGFLNSSVKSNGRYILPLYLDLGNATIEDKLSYILLECICNDIISNNRFSISFDFPHNIYNEGIRYSHLELLNGEINAQKAYSHAFHFEISGYHYRRIVPSENSESGVIISRITQEIDSFLMNCLIREDCRGRISQLVSELVDNSLEHSQSDCLIDIDVTNDYTKNQETEFRQYCGVNIVVSNFSKSLISDGVKKKTYDLEHSSLDKNFYGERFALLCNAKMFHMNGWDKFYNEQDFFTLAAFQHKITSRLESATGGTGLTQLLKCLQDESDAYNCYVLSGWRKLNFLKPFLKLDDNYWCGFNQKHDFFSSLPDKRCFEKSPFYFPGTAYNLNFVLEREVIQHGTNN